MYETLYLFIVKFSFLGLRIRCLSEQADIRHPLMNGPGILRLDRVHMRVYIHGIIIRFLRGGAFICITSLNYLHRQLGSWQFFDSDM